VLSGLIGDRVDNFGVGGYGSDQALLRYQEHCRHGIETTLLMHLTENILRNVNQYRDLLYRGKACGFKPRFIVRADGRLQLVPLPDIGSEHFGHFAADPQKWLKHEVFLPDAAFGLFAVVFLTQNLFRTFSHFHMGANFRGEPWHKSFDRADHPSQALKVTAGILEEFHRVATARGQQPLILIRPTMGDFEYR
jgi:hypothetical protein